MPEYKINTDKHIENFIVLRSIITKFLSGTLSNDDNSNKALTSAISKSIADNGYFTGQNIEFALRAIVDMLDEKKIKQWITQYSISDSTSDQYKTIGIVSAGNIPLVGFHDFLCVLITGNRYLGKLSHQDRHLLPALTEILFEIDNRYKDFVAFSQDKIQSFDAIIATGSNNSERYFTYFFRDYPHIIRKNRNSIAVLGGNESIDELRYLAEDMFQYFGLGCRNISKLFVPAGYDFDLLINACDKFADYANHNKYRNNFDYYKTIFQMNNQPYIDGGFFILMENQSLINPIAAYHYEFYQDVKDVLNFIADKKEQLQCVISNISEIEEKFPFGEAQKPKLNDYADNIDTIKFLLDLRNAQ